jgi:N-acetylmuramoyl-L-alanine amidase
VVVAALFLLAAVSAGPSVGEPAPPPPVTVVAIDAGHGGTNLGAPGLAPGLFEKTVTLALARRIRDLLTVEGAGGSDDAPRGAHSAGRDPAVASPALSVVLCRDSDALIPIRARSRCAAESGARLFLSLHANAVAPGVPAGSRRGFEVFVLGPGEVDDDAAVASLGVANPANAAWAAHEVRAAAEQSVALARVVAVHLGRVVEPAARDAVRQAGASLDVLRGARAPAVLVEVGFMDHPEEGAALVHPAGREPLARALADAVRDYLGGQDAVRTATGRTDSARPRGAPTDPSRTARR